MSSDTESHSCSHESDQVEHSDIRFFDCLPDNQRLLTKAWGKTKKGVEGFTDNPITTVEAERWIQQGNNVGIKLGGIDSDNWTMFVLDVEETGDLPDQAIDVIERCTLAIFESPHGGRNRAIRVTDDASDRLDDLNTKIHLDDDGDHEIELLTSGHALVPPSKVNHSKCSDTKEGCPGHGSSEYEMIEGYPNAEVMTETDVEELIEALGNIEGSADLDNYNGEDFDPDLDQSHIADGEVVLQELKDENLVAFLALIDLLEGGKGKWSKKLTTNGSIDRSLQELMALTFLYQSAIELANLSESRARGAADAIFRKYLSKNDNNRYTDDGQLRRWLVSGEDYHQDRRSRAFGDYHLGKFQRFLKLNSRDANSKPWTWTDEYSRVTYSSVRLAVEYLTGELELHRSAPDLQFYAAYSHDLDISRNVAEQMTESECIPPFPPLLDTNPLEIASSPTYPTRKEVVTVAQLFDNGRANSDETYQSALSRLKKDGHMMMAYCPEYPNGEQYVYFTSQFSNPDAARWVKTEGERTYIEEET